MKKIINKANILLAAFCLVAVSACKDYLDVNTDPNNQPDASIPNILPGAQIGVGFNMGNTVQIVTSLWMQQMAGTGTQTQSYDIYNVTANDFQNDWNSIYSTVLDDLNAIVQKGKAQGNNVQAGMAEVLLAYTYVVTTDMWGDIPQSQALNLVTYPKPVYDPQQNVYQSLITIVDQGIADLQSTNVLDAKVGDLIYAGDVNKWVRAANSLKLKLYLQMRHKDPATATAGINALVAENTFINSNANNLVVAFSTSAGAQNPIYQYTHLTRQNDMIVSTRYYDSLRVLQDPRIPYIFTNVISTQATGVRDTTYATYDNGLSQTIQYPGAGSPANIINRSRWGVYVVGNGTQNNNGSISGAGAAPVRLITKSMVNFWLAEAALTLNTTGEAATYFKQAMLDNFEDIQSFTSAPASFKTSYDAYILNRLTAFEAAPATTSPGGKLNVLIREKWASSAGNGYEAYNDYRRTGFPALTKATNAQSAVTRIPVRLPYAQTEIQANQENVPFQQYPAGILVPVWWMPQ
jgi:hypothetical protein